MAIKLILFDLDGTLIDTKLDITNAINHSLEPLGLPELEADDVIKLVGEGITKLMEKIIGPRHIDRAPEVKERFLAYYSNHIHDFSTPYQGVMETLTSLNNYKKAVVSNKREELSQRLLKGLNMAHFFELILGGDSTPEHKPSPMPVNRAMELLGANPDETVIIGDSNYDILSGMAAEIITIGVTYGYRPIENLKDADYIINDIRKSITIIRGLV